MKRRVTFLLVFIILFCTGTLLAQQYTPEATNRLKYNFNTNWKFYRGSAGGAENPSYSDSSWDNVHLPHAAYIESLVTSGWQGECWYRKHFKLNTAYQGMKVFVEFEAGMQVADVWINGTKKLTHYGGYLPFTIDISDDAHYGDTENVIAVKLVNTDDSSFPPGKSEATMDFCYFHGLYRDVWIYITDPVHVTDAVYANKVAGGGVFVSYPGVSASSATVNVKTHVKNDSGSSAGCAVKTSIVDKNNNVVASNTSNTQTIGSGSDNTFNQSLTVSNPNRWSPDNPYLYTVYTSVSRDGTYVDDYKTRIGIRTINFTHNGGFTINGTRIKFMGANRHQDYPYVGNAVPNNAQYRDALKMKEAGFQYVRTSHYPQDPAFLDACDELGIMVMNSMPGWQYWNSSSTFRNRCYQVIRDMVRRDRNHPGIIVWEASLNESNFDTTFAHDANSIVHEEYPGEVFSTGWKHESYYDVFTEASQHDIRNYSGSRPVIISEYGDWDYGGNSSSSRVARGGSDSALLQQAWNHQESLDQNRALSWLSGDGLWVFNDYNRGVGSNLCLAGPVDIFRLPKYSYFFYQSQRDPNHSIPGVDSGPMVFIASRWESGTSQVKVFSNCDQVELYVNDSLRETRNPDTGSRTANLLHPPLTFNVSFESGKLEARGIIGGSVQATHTIHTPGSANNITVEIDTCGKTPVADGSDLVMVYAYIRSSSGYVVTTAKNNVSFSVSGQGSITGASSINAEAGIAGALLKTTKIPGTITVTASASGLTSGSAQITSVAMTDEYPSEPGNVTPTPTPGPSSLGDVNNDGAIDIVDALLVAQFYVGLSPSNFVQNNADVNCDGNIDIVDALLIAQYYVGLISEFC